MTQALPRCSDAARSRGDSTAGTASPASRWLLIEHPGPWERDAVAASGIAEHVLAELQAAATAARARILLVRRPGRRLLGSVRSWAVVDSSDASTSPTWGSWERDRDLLDAVPLLRNGLPSSSWNREAATPILLVCAHGRHDVCCAVRGRPVALALQASWPTATWECSHVGGDRFAANVVVLPDGTSFGNLDAVSAVAVVRRHLAGDTDPEHFRGLSTEPPVAQVAVAAAVRHWAPASARSFASSSVRRLTPDRWVVRLSGAAPLPDVDVTVMTSACPAARLTCGALRDTAAMAYEVVALKPVGGDAGKLGPPRRPGATGSAPDL